MRIVLSIVFTMAVACPSFAQNVGIGTTAPHHLALLEMQSTGKGILLPRTDTSLVNSGGNVPIALLIYQISDSSFYYYDGSKWRVLIAEGAGILAPAIRNKILFKKIVNGVPEIWTSDYNGNNIHKVNIALPNGIAFSDDMSPRLSPDGLKIFFTAGIAGEYSGDLYSCNADGSAVIKIVDKAGSNNNIILGGAY